MLEKKKEKQETVLWTQLRFQDDLHGHLGSWDNIGLGKGCVARLTDLHPFFVACDVLEKASPEEKSNQETGCRCRFSNHIPVAALTSR